MIDYCTMLFDERERALLPLHLNSLRHYMPDDFNVKISVRPEDLDTIEFCKQFDIEVLQHPIYTQMLHHPGLCQSGFDNANRLHELMKSCTSDWVVLSHLDIIWTADMTESLRPLMNDEYGMLGVWAHGSTIINHKVYSACHYHFWPIMGGLVGRIIRNQPGGRSPFIQLTGNREEGEEFIDISGIDVGELLTMEIQNYSYKFDREGPSPFYFHVGSASFHPVKGPHKDTIEKDIENKIQFTLDKFEEFKS